jgi:16S rRNA (guanine527-N7)-methyltransferase
MDSVQAEKSEFVRLCLSSRGGSPHEVLAKLDRYAELLAEWNQRFNLVAPSTIPHIWSRHFLDSCQLLPLIPETHRILVDLGSGAGFPGLVLAILGVSEVHLVESTGKKAEFLRLVAKTLGLNAVIHQSRAENLRGLKADIITARALAPLNELLPLAVPLMKKDSLCLFLKGQKAEAELTEAKKSWMFDCTRTQSLSDSSGTILAIRNIRKNASRKPLFSRRK